MLLKIKMCFCEHVGIGRGKEGCVFVGSPCVPYLDEY